MLVQAHRKTTERATWDSSNTSFRKHHSVFPVLAAWRNVTLAKVLVTLS